MRSETELWLAGEHFAQLAEQYAAQLATMPINSLDRPRLYLIATRYANFAEALRWARGESLQFINLPPEDRLPLA